MEAARFSSVRRICGNLPASILRTPQSFQSVDWFYLGIFSYSLFFMRLNVDLGIFMKECVGYGFGLLCSPGKKGESTYCHFKKTPNVSAFTSLFEKIQWLQVLSMISVEQ